MRSLGVQHAPICGLAVLASALLACEQSYLSWTPREPLGARHGHVAISVDDRRAGDLASLGHAFGWGGAPREILVDRDHVRARIERLTKEATVTAGIGLWSPGAAPTARLHVEVDELSCDGTAMQAHAVLAIRYTINGADNSARLASQTISAKGEGRACEVALKRALDVLADELSAALVEGPAHDAAVDASAGSI